MTTNFYFFTINVSRCIWIIDSGQSRLNASIKKAFRRFFFTEFIKMYKNKVWSNFVSWIFNKNFNSDVCINFSWKLFFIEGLISREIYKGPCTTL